jgi:hypothetical protein
MGKEDGQWKADEEVVGNKISLNLNLFTDLKILKLIFYYCSIMHIMQ